MECMECKKGFKTLDYLEFHMKTTHFDKTFDNSQYCLSDYCDIFECNEFPEKFLRAQVFTLRDSDNYEGKVYSKSEDPHRIYLMQQYNNETKERLET